jgi:hypothetical protein
MPEDKLSGTDLPTVPSSDRPVPSPGSVRPVRTTGFDPGAHTSHCIDAVAAREAPARGYHRFQHPNTGRTKK